MNIYLFTSTAMSSGLSTICARTDLASTKPLYHVSANCGSTYSGTGVGTGVGEGVGEGVGLGVGEGVGVGVAGATVSATVSSAGFILRQDEVPVRKAEPAITMQRSLKVRLLAFIFPAGLLVILYRSDIDA